jgi:MFS family permease
MYQERARPERIRTWPHAWKLAVATVCFGAFMGQLDASVVTLTYRPVQAAFHAGLAAVEWVSLAYLLTLIALLVPVGRPSDTRGRKLFYLYGFVVFIAASAACGTAPSLGVLIGCRVVQAVGAAMLQANGVALVTTSAPLGRRREALGVQAGAQALGLALGPSLGGILVSTVGWRWVYFINIPVGLIALIGGQYFLPRTRQRSPATPLDWPGVMFLAIATTSLLLGLSSASGLSVPIPFTVAAFALAGGAAWGFVGHQRRATRPLIDPALFADPVVPWGLLGAMCGYLVLFGPLVLVPIAIASPGVSGLTIGLVVTGLPAGFALAAVAGPRILPARLGDRQRATLGAGICSAALAVALVAPLTPPLLIPILAFLGVGLGVFTLSNNTVIMGAIPARASATGGGLLNLTRGLGTALGVATVTLAFHLGSEHAVMVRGERVAVAMLLAGALVAAATSLTATKRRGGQGVRHRRALGLRFADGMVQEVVQLARVDLGGAEVVTDPGHDLIDG